MCKCTEIETEFPPRVQRSVAADLGIHMKFTVQMHKEKKPKLQTKKRMNLDFEI